LIAVLLRQLILVTAPRLVMRFSYQQHL